MLVPLRFLYPVMKDSFIALAGEWIESNTVLLVSTRWRHAHTPGKLRVSLGEALFS